MSEFSSFNGYKVKDEVARSKIELLSNYVTPQMFGAKGDGVTDDTEAIQNAIDNALLNNKIVLLDGVFYTSKTINTKGCTLKGTKQPQKTGVLYKDMGWDYIRNVNAGKNVTFNEYIKEIVDGSAIVSDNASPIITCQNDKPITLINMGVYGWLRNKQICVLYGNDNTRTSKLYFENCTLCNTGDTLLKLQQLELSTIKNCIFAVTNKHCISIENKNDNDFPFEYSLIENNVFNCCRLHAINVIKSFRKSCIIRRNQFQKIGQYSLKSFEDGFGNRILPNTLDDLVYSIYIENNCHNQPINYDFTCSENFGEETNGFLYFNNVTVSNCLLEKNYFLRYFDDNSESADCFYYFKDSYFSHIEVDTINTSFKTKINNNNSTFEQTKGDNMALFEGYSEKPTGIPYFSSIKLNNAPTQHIGDYKRLYSSEDVEEVYNIDLNSLIDVKHSENHPQKPLLVIIGYTGRGGEKTCKYDLFSIQYFIDRGFKLCQITNNLSATCLDDVLSVTVPKNCDLIKFNLFNLFQ